MGRGLIVATLAVIGLLCAAGMGYGAYVVSRGSVAVPVTKLQQSPQSLTPEQVRATARAKAAKAKARKRARTTTTRTVAPPPPTANAAAFARPLSPNIPSIPKSTRSPASFH